MNNARISLLTVSLLLLFSVVLRANPFTSEPAVRDGHGGLPEPAAVRTARPDESLIQRQMALRNRIAEMFVQWKDGSNPSALRILLVLSFLYGVFHALGPGHRKTVIFSIYLARQAPVMEPGLTGLLLALLHGGTAVVVLLALQGVTGAISARADQISRWMEGGSYVLLIILALVLAVRALVEVVRVPGGKKKAAASLGAVLLSGIYPCPGAVLVLVLALTLDMLFVGVLAVFAMSLGMSIPIIAAGYLAWFGRTGIFLGLRAREDRIARLSAGVEFAGYLLLLGFSLYMAQPFLLSLLRMIAVR